MPRLSLKNTRLLAVISLLALPSAAFPAISDLLVAMDNDGRSHFVQHTIGSNGPSVTIDIPGSVIPQEVRFIGPNQQGHTRDHQNNPSQVNINSGTAFARYHHQYGQAVVQVSEDEYVLTALSMPDNISAGAKKIEESTVTWVFPADFEVTEYTNSESPTGKWMVDSNTLRFHQRSNKTATLTVKYKREAAASKNATAKKTCRANSRNPKCIPDIDKDGVPDNRDICLDSKNDNVEALGCLSDKTVVLNEIRFSKNNSYLDVAARQQLDRVAAAIQAQPTGRYEVGSHTDSGGPADYNRAISSSRAEAVRHYLMIKGVSPNALVAQGYGESIAAHSNETAEGRLANRRIVLTKIK